MFVYARLPQLRQFTDRFREKSCYVGFRGKHSHMVIQFLFINDERIIFETLSLIHICVKPIK